ncbi:MAG: AAA family ATPase [Patescibacteria group bacterium]|nr:AAA family ATPase [Patescibacteria group bacterium]
MNDQIITSHELAEELKKTEESVFKSMTGMPTLDRLLGGVEAGELVIVTGPSGEGKTTMLMSITQNMANEGVDSVWFTLEVTPRQFIQKMTRTEKLPLFYIPRNGIDTADPEFVKAWEKNYKKRYEMIDWIEVKILEAQAKAAAEGRNLRCVFIDHIHQIFSIERVERNISLELGDMVAKIKKIAVENNIVVFLVAHNKDPQEGATLREPRKEDIRDSGLIVRLADTVIGVWRIPNDDDGTAARRKVIAEDDNKAKIRVFKNRREGKLGSFVMYHIDHFLTEDAFVGDF